MEDGRWVKMKLFCNVHPLNEPAYVTACGGNLMEQTFFLSMLESPTGGWILENVENIISRLISTDNKIICLELTKHIHNEHQKQLCSDEKTDSS
jgi:hypothetical protein